MTELRNMGIELMATFWPFMNSSSVNFPDYAARGLLALNRSSGEPDMFWTYLQ